MLTYNKLFFIKKSNFLMSTLAFCLFYISITILRIFINSGTVDLLKQQGYIILSALCFLSICNIWNFCKKIIIWFCGFWILYCSALFIKFTDGMIILDREVVHTISFATCLCSLVFMIRYLGFYINRWYLQLMAYILLTFGLICPLLVLGYFVVSGWHMISADIILTLFQTNASEVRSYLVEQNLFLWVLSIIVIFAIIISSIIALKNMRYNFCNKENNKKLLFLSIFYLYIIVCIFPKLTSCFILDLTNTVLKTLESFKIYEQTRDIRTQRLQNLKNILQQNTNDGIYVLVVGESTARHHMNVFGYNRPNTPWLSKMAKSPNTLLFKNTYSNHVHTVPAVQYALSELNQYQNISVEDAYSIVEIAKAAGFTTYWISNQKQFNVSDTPLTTIAASANHQIWLNSYAGNKTMTTYYDDKLSENLPDITKAKKMFIILHLMGCHSVYKERYPAEYDVFHGENSRIDEYDNAVLYNDFVLQKIYNQLKDNPNFMAFIYFSDHGEDPDNGFTHEASKFTYAMSKIPLVMIFSDKFVNTNQNLFATLKKHTNKYITSDLIYNAMISLLGIKYMPRINPILDISSPDYGMTSENLLTVHGQKHISGDVKK